MHLNKFMAPFIKGIYVLCRKLSTFQMRKWELMSIAKMFEPKRQTLQNFWQYFAIFDCHPCVSQKENRLKVSLLPMLTII